MGQILGRAAPKPQQAGGQDRANLAEVGWEVRQGGRGAISHGAAYPSDSRKCVNLVLTLSGEAPCILAHKRIDR